MFIVKQITEILRESLKNKIIPSTNLRNVCVFITSVTFGQSKQTSLHKLQQIQVHDSEFKHYQRQIN